MEYETPKNLYHYCSLSTFYNIIKNQSIWVSDLRKSNDFLEIVWLRQLFEHKMNEEFNKFIPKVPANSLDQFIEMRRNISECFRIEFSKTWAFCLSEEKDLLSQWRGYADNGSGISIGFKGDFLDKLCTLYTSPYKNPKATIFFDKVSYSKEEAINCIDIETCLSKCSNCNTISDFKTTICRAMTEIGKEAPFFKNPAFIEEKEWRIVITYIMDRFSGADLSGFNTDDYQFGKLNYIVSNNTLVSHFEIKFPNIKNAISEIVIGPKCTESIVDIKHFLVSVGILANMEDKSIEITKSQASYR